MCIMNPSEAPEVVETRFQVRAGMHGSKRTSLPMDFAGAHSRAPTYPSDAKYLFWAATLHGTGRQSLSDPDSSAPVRR